MNYDKLTDAINLSGKRKADLCRACNRPRYWLNDVLRQHSKIPLEDQIVLARELGVTVEWLNDQPEKETAIATEQVRTEIMARLFTMTDEELLKLLEELKK